MRPFKGLPIHEDPARCYDVVIVGAGIGGLVSAALLADSGMRVLVVEQHYVVGGYCSSFFRKGFSFDAASHFYPLLGNPQSITGKLLRRLGIPTEWIKMDPVDHFHFPDGTRWSVPADFDAYLAGLKSKFPHQATQLDDFFSEVNRLYLLGLLAYFRGKETDRIARYESESVREALDRHFDDPQLKLYLTADCPHWGSPPSRVSYIFDCMLRLSYFLGNYYPRGGSQVFADDLARRIEASGGQVALRAEAQKIRIERGKVVGIELEMGPLRNRRRLKIDSPIVISNADMLQTAGHLIGPDLFGREALAELGDLRCSCPCFLMHIGLENTTAEELQEAQGYYWDEWDPDVLGTMGLRYKLFVPTMFDRSVAPEGSQIIIIQKVIEGDYAAMDADHKERLDRFITGHLEATIPRFRERAVVKLSASARTSYRYTLNHEGAMLGWEMSPGQLGRHRPAITSPFEGLFFTGHWTRPGGGITPVIVSAMQVAREITGERYL